MGNNVKRLNLYFNLDNEKAKEAYEIISNSIAKTAFIVDAVLAYKKSQIVDKQKIKEAVREALCEVNCSLEIYKNDEVTENNDIPDDIFNMLADL